MADEPVETPDIVREWILAMIGGMDGLVRICEEAIPDSVTIELGENRWVYTVAPPHVRDLVIDCLCDDSELRKHTNLWGSDEHGYEEGLASAAQRIMDEYVDGLYSRVSTRVRESVRESTGIVIGNNVDMRPMIERATIIHNDDLVHNDDHIIDAPYIHSILEDIEIPTIVEPRLPVDAECSMWDSYISLCTCMQIFEGDLDRVHYEDSKLGKCTLSPHEFLRDIDDWLPDCTIEWLCRTQGTTLAEVMERDELGRFVNQGMFANTLRAEIASFGVDHIFPYLSVPCTCTGTELLHLVATSYGGGREVALTIPAGTHVGLYDPEEDGFCGRFGIYLERDVDVPPEMACGYADVGRGTPASIIKDLSHDSKVDVHPVRTDIKKER